MAEAARNKKQTVLLRKSNLNLRKRLIKCQIWIIAVGGVETLTHSKLFVKIFLTNAQFTLNYQKFSNSQSKFRNISVVATTITTFRKLNGS